MKIAFPTLRKQRARLVVTVLNAALLATSTYVLVVSILLLFMGGLVAGFFIDALRGLAGLVALATSVYVSGETYNNLRRKAPTIPWKVMLAAAVMVGTAAWASS